MGIRGNSHLVVAIRTNEKLRQRQQQGVAGLLASVGVGREIAFDVPSDGGGGDGHVFGRTAFDQKRQDRERIVSPHGAAIVRSSVVCDRRHPQPREQIAHDPARPIQFFVECSDGGVGIG